MMSMVFLFSLAVLIFFVGLLLQKWTTKKNPGTEQPPSPRRIPIIGNLHQLGDLPHRSLAAMADRYGPLMLLKLGNVPTLIVSSKEVAEEVMKTRDLAFASRPPSIMADLLLYGSRDIAFSPYGEYWRQLRRISVHHLLTSKRVQSFRHVKEDEVSAMVEKIRAADGGRVNLSELLGRLTVDIICRVALGRKYSMVEKGGKSSNKYHELLTEFMILIGTFPVGDYIPWLGWVDKLSGLHGRAKRTALELDSFIEQVLEDHLHLGSKAEEDKDLVDVLLSLHNDGEVPLDRDSIKAIILDMFVGGTQTTYATLEMMMAELMRNPAVLKKVQEEIRKNVKRKTIITDEDISRMVYLKAVIKETFRLHPAVPLLLPREATENSRLHGYEVPAKTRVFVNVWAIGRDPKCWERPEKFFPERFIDSSIDFKGQDFELLPFGAGRRCCPGPPFAAPNIELAIANLLYHFDWAMPDGGEGEEMDMTEVAGVAVHKKSNLVLVAIPQTDCY